MHLRSFLDQQVAAHRVRPMIVVSPNVQVPRAADTECVNGQPGETQMETFVPQDVPRWVADHFRARADRGSWATIGLSSGGYCAAMAAMLHPAQYGGAPVMAGYFRPRFDSSYQPLRSGDAAQRRVGAVLKTDPLASSES